MSVAYDYADAYQPDRSLRGKLRRRLVRMVHRRPLPVAPERPMVSFAFDDAPVSAAREGARILEQRGLRGTYFVSAGLAGTQAPMGLCAGADDYRRLAANGHEIGCHTFSHIDCGVADGASVRSDVARNLDAFKTWGLPTPTTFAYPYGDVGPAAKAALNGRYALLRALHPGVVEEGADMNQAPAVGIEGPDGESEAMRWLAAARERRAWVILYTHDVACDPSPWGCTPDTLERLADWAVANGFESYTVAEGARTVGL